MHRHLRTAIVTVLTVGAILLGTGGRAVASSSWVFDDGFEGSTTAWYGDCEGCGYRCPAYVTCDPAYVSSYAPSAQTGTHSAVIGSTAGTPGAWRSFGRRVRIPADAVLCSMRVAIRSSTNDATVNVEVIGTSSWTYETIRTYHLTNTTYANFSAGSWTPGPRDVTIRLAVLGEGGVGVVYADDFRVACVW
ncbi:hypothetical protein Daura_24010 [Dactylosporangium aurantiacum]|uniref:Uncharacterized protein n=1 Tax=Dactylosporangium aurantiacum TaxID=35754 RepID=A0A9Q9MH24_9ACTN|nr:hypothetical protein [Dactylosporangium aurantiacum]MDG6103843.1 hypothetical protein [Dactylosporangium aurantiacum]UWZ58958.1 hypothetical protein Daura_24010 [Dactylosporangium aurantiacum]